MYHVTLLVVFDHLIHLNHELFLDLITIYIVLFVTALQLIDDNTLFIKDLHVIVGWVGVEGAV